MKTMKANINNCKFVVLVRGEGGKISLKPHSGIWAYKNGKPVFGDNVMRLMTPAEVKRVKRCTKLEAKEFLKQHPEHFLLPPDAPIKIAA